MSIDQAGNHGLPLEVDAPDVAPGTDMLLLTAVNRPFWISACETTRLAESIVWILPFVRTRSTGAGCDCASSFAPVKPPSASAPAPPRNCLRPSPSPAS